MTNVNRGRYHVQLSASDWQALADPLPGFRFIGVISRGAHVAALARDSAGAYFAINGRAIAPLIARKVEAAIGAREL